jgi:multidrug transporter EmrE-like cation transporter
VRSTAATEWRRSADVAGRRIARPGDQPDPPLTRQAGCHAGADRLAKPGDLPGLPAAGRHARWLPTLPTALAFWGNVLYLVLFCTLFAFFAMNYALRHSSATRVALLTGSEPVFGAAFAVLWLGESLPPASWLGGGLMVAASLWAVRPRRVPQLARA